MMSALTKATEEEGYLEKKTRESVDSSNKYRWRKMETAAQDSWMETTGLRLMFHGERQGISQVSHSIKTFITQPNNSERAKQSIGYSMPREHVKFLVQRHGSNTLCNLRQCIILSLVFIQTISILNNSKLRP